MTSKIVYDAECSFCRRQVERIKKLNRGKNAFEYIPRQREGLLALYPSLQPFENIDGMRFIDDKGVASVSCDAVVEIAKRLPGLAWTAMFYKLPPCRWVARRVYNWIAKNRYRWNPPCENDSCKLP
jgi:predicted DCC family thiol-disulfide oxidoreductase YuxK